MCGFGLRKNRLTKEPHDWNGNTTASLKSEVTVPLKQGSFDYSNIKISVTQNTRALFHSVRQRGGKAKDLGSTGLSSPCTV